MSSIIRALERHSSTTPGKTAVSARPASLSWRQLHSEVVATGAALAGCRAIGLHMGNSPAWIVADLAAMAAGIMVVPLPTFFSDTQIQHAIQDARLDTIITDNPRRTTSLASAGSTVEVKLAGGTHARQFLTMNNAGPRGANAAKVTYTSGTTGTPRGVRLAAHAIERVAGSLAAVTDATRDDRALVVLPLSILLENIGSVYVPILAGARILVPGAAELGISGSSGVDADRFAAALDRLRPTTMIVPPHLLKLLVALGQQGRLPGSFRFIAVGGAPVGTRLLDAAHALGLPVYQGYGLSETCSVVALNTPAENRPGSVGKPLPHARVRVGAGGCIRVGGIAFEGYLNEPDLGANAEIETGDIGHLDEDGYLYVTGRADNLIMTGYGRNISPEWVESELVSHPCIAQAAVFGEARSGLSAVLVPAVTLAPDQLGDALSEVNARLPDYARVNRHVVARSPFRAGTGELTPSGAPARAVIARRHA